MKRFLMFILLILGTVAIFAQEVDPVTPGPKQQLLAWLLAQWNEHMWTILALVWAVISEYLGTSKKIKESALYQFIINRITAFLTKKKEILPTVKGKFMTDQNLKAARGIKLILLVLILSGIGYTAAAQDVSIWKPVPKYLLNFKSATPGEAKDHIWLPRWATGMSAIQVWYDKTDKTLKQEPFSKIGVGMSAARYERNIDGELINDLSFSGFVYLPTKDPLTGISIVGVVSALKFAGISPGIGAGYDFGLKAPIAVFNAVLNF